MTLTEFDEKIEQLKAVQAKATGMKLAELTSVIDDLTVARVELATEALINLEAGISSSDLIDLKNIAIAFENGTAEIAEANNLIDNVISIGKKIIALT